MRVAGAVGVLVMTSVRRDPTHERTLERERAQHGQHDLERTARHEAAVGEESVVSGGDAEDGDDVAHDQQSEVEPRDALTDQPGEGEHGRDERHHDHRAGDEQLQWSAHRRLLGVGLVTTRQVTLEVELADCHCAPFRDGRKAYAACTAGSFSMTDEPEKQPSGDPARCGNSRENNLAVRFGQLPALLRWMARSSVPRYDATTLGSSRTVAGRPSAMTRPASRQ